MTFQLSQVYNSLKVKRIKDIEIPTPLKPLIDCMSLLEKDTLEKDQLNSIILEISNYIDKGLLKIDTILHLLNTASIIRPKNINFYIDFCKFIIGKYGIENESIQTNIFKLDSIFELVALDKIDDLKNLDFDINQTTSKNLSLIDIACKFGSYKCFQYLKLLGCKITNERFAIEGGNKDIIIDTLLLS